MAEQDKIGCGEAHFAALDSSVKYGLGIKAGQLVEWWEVLPESVFVQRLLEVEGWGIAISFYCMKRKCSVEGERVKR